MSCLPSRFIIGEPAPSISFFDAVQNGKYPPDWFVKISLLPVTKDNMDDLYKRWTGWLQGEQR
jgi:hypothetical protein